jgi:ornithine carbamoyltransferase
VRIATPSGYELSDADVALIRSQGIAPMLTSEPKEAVDGADAVYTDVWTSMGQEQEAARRIADFAGFTVDEALVDGLNEEGIFLHCLPAHRGEEVTDDVLEGDRSRIWQQATNRMHAARGAMVWLLQQSDR